MHTQSALPLTQRGGQEGRQGTGRLGTSPWPCVTKSNLLPLAMNSDMRNMDGDDTISPKRANSSKAVTPSTPALLPAHTSEPRQMHSCTCARYRGRGRGSATLAMLAGTIQT